MPKPTELNDDTFDQAVLEAETPVLVDFWATWCRPCAMIAPVLDELAEEYSGRVAFAKLNVDVGGKTASKYGVMSIPNLIIFKNGQPAAQIIGFKPKEELKRELDAVLA